jgi:hypothetical protein
MEVIMRRFVILVVLMLSIISWSLTASRLDSALIIDHHYVHPDQIPSSWIDSVKANCKWHYAHTSHGSQLTIGLGDLEGINSTYDVDIGSCNLPNNPSALCIHDGQVSQTYITPELYWQSTAGMNNTRAVLNGNTNLNYSGWSWCCQVNSYNESQVQAYLDSINQLEQEFPNVTFIYMTGNAQTDGSGGYNRYLRNEQIRQYCRGNDKVLFDFADLDCWWYNDTTGLWEQNTYSYNSQNIPLEHPAFNGNYGGHTTYESCLQKGCAVWYMFAVLCGWQPMTAVEEIEGNHNLGNFNLAPNPFTDKIMISFTLQSESRIQFAVYNLAGQKIFNLTDSNYLAGSHQLIWDGQNDNREVVNSGIYFYKISVNGNLHDSGELIFIK